ncbi:hypothetical protein ACQKM2_09850 [Streptomyces sp. NPDC004126]|uniref:hypothetical protein n=1 Tax=Streptomyces sp. NPDC004126 TaxID=3390695 RepID=UPI003D052A06
MGIPWSRAVRRGWCAAAAGAVPAVPEAYAAAAGVDAAGPAGRDAFLDAPGPFLTGLGER